MRNRVASVAMGAGLVVAGLIGARMGAWGQAAPGAQAPVLPPPLDTALLRSEYDQWRTQFKTWGRWAPLGQES